MKKFIVSFICGAIVVCGILFSNDDFQTASAYEPKPLTDYETS
ncbi:hypothetical protein [Virgibacillus dokdonensis]|nr:hypothetical protein [Virgibacillus dokdonensis]